MNMRLYAVVQCAKRGAYLNLFGIAAMFKYNQCIESNSLSQKDA